MRMCVLRRAGYRLPRWVPRRLCRTRQRPVARACTQRLEEVQPHQPRPFPFQRELSRGVLGQEGVFWARDHHCCPWLYLWVGCNSGISNSGGWSCPPSRLTVGTAQHERGRAKVFPWGVLLTDLELWRGFLVTFFSITCLKLFRCLAAVRIHIDNLLNCVFSVGAVAFTLNVCYAGELPRIKLPFLYILCLAMENRNLARCPLIILRLLS